MWSSCIVFLVFLIWMIVASTRDSRRRRRRKKALLRWARANGLERVFDPPDMWAVCPGLQCLSIGTPRVDVDMMKGRWRGHEIVVFEHSYGSGRVSWQFGAVVVNVGRPLRPLLIRAEGFKDRVLASLGYEDINFESDEFSRRFYVQGPDRRWAYAAIHPRMMELLLAVDCPFGIEFGETHLIVCGHCHMMPKEFAVLADVAVGIVDLLPEHLLDEGGPAE